MIVSEPGEHRRQMFVLLAVTLVVIGAAIGIFAFGNAATSGQAIADGSGASDSGSSGGVGVATAGDGGLQVASVVPLGGHAGGEIGEGTIGNTLTVVGGKVGINFPAPVNAFDVAGDIKNTGKITTPQLCLGSGGVVDCKTAWPAGGTGAAYASIAEVSGNIGVGTTSPVAKLDVAGTFKAGVPGTAPVAAPFSATGGTVTQSGGYTIHTFTSSGTFTPSGAGTVEVLVVGGGGGGGGGYQSPGGGGGGAGGVLYNQAFAVTQGPLAVTIGEGGVGGIGGWEASGGDGRVAPGFVRSTSGANSVFGSLVAIGGGGGGNYNAVPGLNGGSGGGGSYHQASANSGQLSGGVAGSGSGGAAGLGTVGQGNQGGGNANVNPSQNGPGGGGAGGVGENPSAVQNTPAGAGGVGKSHSISGASVYYGGGGGGGNGYNGDVGFGTRSAGGMGGGGQGGLNTGASPGTLDGMNGAPNTGGGGGGAGGIANAQLNSRGGNGGSGIVIVRYLTNGGSASGPAIATTAQGNVGIGTASPVSKLDVAGEVRAQSFALSDGSKIAGGVVRLSSPETAGALDCTGAEDVGGFCGVAKGKRWDMPQTKLTFNLARQSTVTLRMTGSLHVYGGSSASNPWNCGSHYGAGFLVDGVRMSNYDWGEVVGSVQYTTGTWWQGYAVERDVVLATGAHTVQGFVYHYEGSTCGYVMLDNRENYGPVLFVTIW